MKKFKTLSNIQKRKYKEISGYEYQNNSLSGRFSTHRPYDKDDWEYSPWVFSYLVDQTNGYLFCELDHRMTNNRACGWDQEGKEIDRSVVDMVFPPHA